MMANITISLSVNEVEELYEELLLVQQWRPGGSVDNLLSKLEFVLPEDEVLSTEDEDETGM